MFYIIFRNMGGSLQKVISRCCRFPSLGCKDSEETKKVKSKKIIPVIPANEGSEQETDLNFAKKDSTLQLQSTTNTNMFSHSNASFAISDIRIIDISSQTISFQTVKQKVKKEVLGTFMKFFQQKYGIFQQNKQQDGVWRQTQTGSFVCMKQDQFKCIFSHEAYYEGEIKRDGNLNYLPHGKGILIVGEGLYQGNFIEGRANGTGQFTQSKTRTSFEGEWLDGSFTTGVIQNQSIIFRGTMLNGLAEGQGSLFFKKTFEQYKGSFKNGLFQGESCMILSKDYQYIGGFKAGKKEGTGRLMKAEEKTQLITKSLKIKSYFPPLNLLGQWQSDTFIKAQPKI